MTARARLSSRLGNGTKAQSIGESDNIRPDIVRGREETNKLISFGNDQQHTTTHNRRWNF